MYSINELLKQDKCYCYKRKEIINLKDCEIFECRNSKSCLTKTNNKYEKEMKDAEKKSKNI